MDDLISRSALLQAIKRQFRCAECNNYDGIRCRACPGDDMMDLVEDCLAVDAVEVVRCKDCVYFKKRHVRLADGTERDYADGEEYVTADVGINVGSQCRKEEEPCFREGCDFCSRGVRRKAMRLIDKDALRKPLVEWLNWYSNSEAVKSAVREVVESIDEAPTIEAEPVRHAKYDAAGDCTNCGFPMPTDDRIDAIFEEEIRYCYHCGAKMSGGAEDGKTD